jgi:hypothetical protein
LWWILHEWIEEERESLNELNSYYKCHMTWHEGWCNYRLLDYSDIPKLASVLRLGKGQLALVIPARWWHYSFYKCCEKSSGRSILWSLEW